MSGITGSTKHKSCGTVVQCSFGHIGVIKWYGEVPNVGKTVGLFNPESIPSSALGDFVDKTNIPQKGDGTLQGKILVDKPARGGIVFVPEKLVTKIIHNERLLKNMKGLTNEVKTQKQKIAQLKDQIKGVNQTPVGDFIQQPAQPQINDHSDQAVKGFLEKEIKKGWYCTFNDLCSRFDTRNRNEVENIWDNHKDKFDLMKPKQHHTRIVYTVSGSQRDNLFASGSDDKSIRLWRRDDDGKARCIHSLQIRSCINSLAFSPDGSTLAAALDSGWIELFDMATGKNCGALEGQTTSEVWTCAFSPDGKWLISGALDRAVRVWDTANRDCMFALRGHDEWVNGVAVARDGSFIVSGSGDKTVRTWNTKQMSQDLCLRGHTDFVRSVCVTENCVVSASDDCCIRVWTGVKEGKTTNTTVKGHTKGIYCVSSAGRGDTYASASRDATVRVWQKDKQVKLFKNHKQDVNSCCFIDKGRYVISGSDDKTVQCMKVE